MHHQRVGFGVFQFLAVQAVKREKLPGAGHQAFAHAFLLQAQRHHDVGAGQAVPHVVMHGDAEAGDFGRDQRRRADQADEIAHHGEEQQVRTGDAGMGDVAADGDGQAVQPALAAANGERVQQRLGRVFMGAVAGVDYRGFDFLREQSRRAGAVVADHQQVAVHRVQRGGGVQQGLALGDRKTWKPTCSARRRRGACRPARSWCGCGWSLRRTG